MTKTIEEIPEWSMCYLFNSDADGLTEEDIQEIEKWSKKNKMVYLSLREDEDGFTDPYFSTCPAFGLPTVVYSCDVFCED